MKVKYFAWVRERVGKSEETVEPPADVRTVADLIAWLAKRGEAYAYAFETPRVIRAAIDHAHVKPDTMIDGAGVFTIYRRVILPLCTPALAALATLLFTWIYNDFFWSLFLFVSGGKRPITAALNDLSGAYFTDPTQLAALSVMAAIPTVIVYLVLQRYFVRGLTLGTAKG